MLNSIVLIGRLCKDPELRYTQAGKAVATMRLAVDRGTKDAEGKNEADFIDVIVWEKQAESCANYLQKGRLVAVQGRLQSRSYETQEGQRREKAEVVASQVRFLDRGQDSGGERPSKAPKGDTGSTGTKAPGNDDDVPWA